MKLPRTAKDDHPGPIGFRPISTGFDWEPTVCMGAPRMRPSRFGPRKPDQLPPVVATSESALLFSGELAVAGAGVGDVGRSLAGVGLGVSAGAAAGMGEGATGSFSLPAWARRRCSAVGVHRQWRSELPSPEMPPVRKIVKTPHASRLVTTSEARRGPLDRDRRRLATAQTT